MSKVEELTRRVESLEKRLFDLEAAFSRAMQRTGVELLSLTETVERLKREEDMRQPSGW